jgi:hypothetical protein
MEFKISNVKLDGVLVSGVNKLKIDDRFLYLITKNGKQPLTYFKHEIKDIKSSKLEDGYLIKIKYTQDEYLLKEFDMEFKMNIDVYHIIKEEIFSILA